MAFNLATAFTQLDTKGDPGALGIIDKVMGTIQDMAKTPVGPLGEQVNSLARQFASLLDPINKVSTALAGLVARAEIAGRITPWLGLMGNFSARSGDAMKGKMGELIKSLGSDPQSVPGGMRSHTEETRSAIRRMTSGVGSLGSSHLVATNQGVGKGISGGLRAPTGHHVPMVGVGRRKTGSLFPALSAVRGARPRLLAGKAAAEQQFQFTSLADLADKMQQEAAQQDADKQQLLAQQEANQHLGALAGAAGGPGLRVQIVGTQSGQW